jgi:hypothetical protein
MVTVGPRRPSLHVHCEKAKKLASIGGIALTLTRTLCLQWCSPLNSEVTLPENRRADSETQGAGRMNGHEHAHVDGHGPCSTTGKRGRDSVLSGSTAFSESAHFLRQVRQ